MAAESVIRFAHQGQQLAQSATANTVKASAASVSRETSSQDGSGTVVIEGDYTGSEDLDIELEITANPGSTSRASEPVYLGAGSHVMTDLSVSGLAEQELTFTLKSLGTETKQARYILYGVEWEAIPIGNAGNAIRLACDPTNSGAGATLPGITKAALSIATLEDIAGARGAGTDFQRLPGVQWDFGGLPLEAGGLLADATPRLAFGEDHTVYRQWMEVEGTERVYYLDQQPARTIPAGTQVYSVTGGRTFTLSDGVDTETFVDIVTVFDLLTALLSSRFIRPALGSVIVEDRQPGGAAVDDANIRTDPYVLAIEGSGSDFAKQVKDLSLNLQAGTPTQTVKLTCVNTRTVGAEQWAVTGPVSGSLGTVFTGVTATLAGLGSLLVPRKLPDAIIRPVSWTFQGRFQAETPEAETFPRICRLDRPVIGAAGLPSGKTFRFTRKKRPSDACSCAELSGVRVSGNPVEECLGIEIEDEALTTASPGYIARYANLAAKHNTFEASNRSLASGKLSTAANDLNLARKAFRILKDTLTQLYESGTLSYSAWADGVQVNAFEIREPTTRNGYLYRAIIADYAATATTGGTEPTWGASPAIGDVIADTAGLEWECFGKIPDTAWNEWLTDVYDTDIVSLQNIDAGSSTPSLVAWPTGVIAGAGIDQQAYPNDLLVTSDGTVWRVVSYEDQDGTLPKAPFPAPPPPVGVGNSSSVSAAGETDDAGTATSTGFSVVIEQVDRKTYSGTADIQTITNALETRGITGAVDAFVDTYKARATEILSWAGITSGKFEASTGAGSSPCWRDRDDLFFWEVTSGDERYLPAFDDPNGNGVDYWHSAKLETDPNTGEDRIVSTQEAAFGIIVACLSDVSVGDTIDVTLEGGGINAAYREGDTIEADIVGAAPLFWSQGQTGNDTQIWAGLSSTEGALPDYSVIHGSEALYSETVGAGTLQLRIYRDQGQESRGLPGRVGDVFTIRVQRNQVRYRLNSGAWVGPVDIPVSTLSLGSGLAARFSAGASGASFVSGDSWVFKAEALWSPGHALSPNREVWASSSATGKLTLLCGAGGPVDTVAIARHKIPEGATVTVNLWSGMSIVHTAALAWNLGPLILALDDPLTVTSVEVEIAGATGGFSIGWVLVAQGWIPARGAQDVSLTVDYDMAPGALGEEAYLGEGLGGTVAWDGWHLEADRQQLLALLRRTKQNNNEPFIFTPNASYPDLAALVRLRQSRVEIRDRLRYEAGESRRFMSLSLPLEAVTR